MPTKLLARCAVAVTCTAGLAVAAVPAGASAAARAASPIPNYPNPQFDPSLGWPRVVAWDGTVVPVPNYPNPQFDPQS